MIEIWYKDKKLATVTATIELHENEAVLMEQLRDGSLEVKGSPVEVAKATRIYAALVLRKMVIQ